MHGSSQHRRENRRHGLCPCPLLWNLVVYLADAALLHDYFIVANFSNHEILVHQLEQFIARHIVALLLVSLQEVRGQLVG